MEYTVDDFKARFDRGQFLYGDTVPEIRDKDIEEAMAEAGIVFNVGLVSDEDKEKLIFSYLVAHYLQTDLDIEDSEGGVSLLQSSRSVNGFSASYVVPEWMAQSESLTPYTRTGYGIKYVEMMRPYLFGARVSVVQGRTLP